MDRPCIVCQENCPVSPKAIHTFDYFKTVRDGKFTVKNATATTIETVQSSMTADKFSSGDYYCTIGKEKPRKIVANSKNKIEIEPSEKFTNIPAKADVFEIQIYLQGPEVDIEKCNGCGICEHECPVTGLRAIRITAEGETRNSDRGLLL
ncbi:MAG: 4Fe-4S binding protein [Planctomycetes bacterium]|nr:4Fe-4S binding protein [Planctomycetota bacterium]